MRQKNKEPQSGNSVARYRFLALARKSTTKESYHTRFLLSIGILYGKRRLLNENNFDK